MHGSAQQFHFLFDLRALSLSLSVSSSLINTFLQPAVADFNVYWALTRRTSDAMRLLSS